jgi:hypothetical protein
MKKILLTLLCVTFVSGLFAQSLSLQDTNGVAINHGSTIQVMGNPSDLVITVRINLKNDATEDKKVSVKKVIHEGDTLPLTVNYFCWGACFPPDIYEPSNFQNIPAGGISEEFFGDYNPQSVPGISRVMYVFYVTQDRNDSVAVTVEYNASPASVGEDLAGNVKFTDAYPNPAVSMVNVGYSIPASVNKAEIVITNMLGSKVKEVGLDSFEGNARIEVSDLLNGIYFYSLVADGQLILTKKFVVRR